jgi:hypothetical protein
MDSNWTVRTGTKTTSSLKGQRKKFCWPCLARILCLDSLHIVKDVVVIFRAAFSIRPVIHPWMASYREENPDRNK